MPNERLRALLLERRVTPAKLAEAVQVDRRPSSGGSSEDASPNRRHRYDIAAFFGVDESYIWPDALDRDEIIAASESEIIAIYPHRWAVPRDTWGHLFEQADTRSASSCTRASSWPRTLVSSSCLARKP
jgi:hypothetical protein